MGSEDGIHFKFNFFIRLISSNNQISLHQRKVVFENKVYWFIKLYPIYYIADIVYLKCNALDIRCISDKYLHFTNNDMIYCDRLFMLVYIFLFAFVHIYQISKFKKQIQAHTILEKYGWKIMVVRALL